MEINLAKPEIQQTVWVSLVGTRPQFVKLAPVCRAVEDHNRRGRSPKIAHFVVHTGQHYDHEVAELLFDQMSIPEPDCNLNVGSGSHATQLARMLERLEPQLLAYRPDWIIHYGDTNSTLAGALVAARLRIPGAHVEAGCRSGDFGMPEEQTRIVTDQLSRLLLAASPQALSNLEREGIGVPGDPLQRRNVFVGDVMLDALLENSSLADEYSSATLQAHGISAGEYYLLTLHRAENTENPSLLAEIIQAVGSLDLPVIFPVHPRTRAVFEGASIHVNGRIRPISPVGYIQMLALEKNARKILTDSGGVQKEAFYLGVPCVTLRDQTEWPETVELGANRISGTDPRRICEAVYEDHVIDFSQSAPYGDGTAAQKIVRELLST